MCFPQQLVVCTLEDTGHFRDTYLSVSHTKREKLPPTRPAACHPPPLLSGPEMGKLKWVS